MPVALHFCSFSYQVSRLGYPVRIRHALFLRDYSVVSSRPAADAARAIAASGDAKGASAALVSHLLDALRLEPGTVQVRIAALKCRHRPL